MKRLIPALTLFFCLIGFKSINAQTNLPTIITSSQTWDLAGSPYIVSQNTLIDSAAIITINPGVEVYATSYIQLDVNGIINAKGTKDSVIRINNINIRLKKKTYEVTKQRFVFSHCSIGGDSVRVNQLFYMEKVEVDFKNVYFHNFFYGISTFNTFPNVLIDSCTFYSYQANTYPISSTAVFDTLTFLNSKIINGSGLGMTANVLKMQKSEVRNIVNYYDFDVDSVADISCNRFIEIEDGIEFNFRSTPKQFLFYNNTIDKSGNRFSTIHNPMIKIWRLVATTNLDVVEFKGNNFLDFYPGTTQGRKVEIYGSNSNPSTYKDVTFNNNYWGTTDTLIIDSFIYDYHDNNNIFGEANYGGFLSSPVTTCGIYVPEPCTADFSFYTDSVNKDKFYFQGSTPPTGGSSKFTVREGSTSTDYQGQYASHTFTGQQGVVVWYLVYDAQGNLCDSLGKDIQRNPDCVASFYFGIDSLDKCKIYIVNNSQGATNSTQYSWSFGDGSASKSGNPSHTYTGVTNNSNFNICMQMQDGTTNCLDTICKQFNFYSTLGCTSGIVLANVMDQTNLIGASIPAKSVTGIRAYPNPSNGIVNLSVELKSSKNVTIKLLSSIGEVVLERYQNMTTGDNLLSLDLKNQINGLYFIHLQAGNENKTIKLLLSK